MKYPQGCCPETHQKDHQVLLLQTCVYTLKFLSDEIRKLYPEQNDITGMIEGTIVDMANNDPDMALRVLMTLYNDIGEFYQGMQSDDNPD